MKINKTQDIKDVLEGLIGSDKEIALAKLNEIIDLLPPEYSELINEAFIHKRVPKEYLLSSIFFTVSTSIGLVFYIKALGYKNFANLYFIIIGSRGDTKSEAMKIATERLKETDDEDYDEYEYELKTYDKENEDKPTRKQILLQNASIEAAQEAHSNNPNSIGIYIDEIYSMIENMSNSSSRDGVAWRSFFLEGNTNSHIDISRKTTKSFRIKETYPTLLGGLQHQFVPKLFANGNLYSGFIDRLLFTPKLTTNDKLSREQMSPEIINNYKCSLINILDYKRESDNPDSEIKKFEVHLTKGAEDTLFCYVQSLIKRQMNAETPIKEYMSKMQISIHKFCLLVHMMKTSKDSDFMSSLDIETVELAIKINEFYFINFKIILEENLLNFNKEPSIDEIIKIAKKNNASQKAVAEITGLHKATISKRWKKDEDNRQLATSNSLKNAG